MFLWAPGSRLELLLAIKVGGKRGRVLKDEDEVEEAKKVRLDRGQLRGQNTNSESRDKQIKAILGGGGAGAGAG